MADPWRTTVFEQPLYFNAMSNQSSSSRVETVRRCGSPRGLRTVGGERYGGTRGCADARMITRQRAKRRGVLSEFHFPLSSHCRTHDDPKERRHTTTRPHTTSTCDPSDRAISPADAAVSRPPTQPRVPCVCHWSEIPVRAPPSAASASIEQSSGPPPLSSP